MSNVIEAADRFAKAVDGWRRCADELGEMLDFAGQFEPTATAEGLREIARESVRARRTIDDIAILVVKGTLTVEQAATSLMVRPEVIERAITRLGSEAMQDWRSGLRD